MTVAYKWAGYLSRLDKSVHICMLLTKEMFLIKDKNVGLCLYISKCLSLKAVHCKLAMNVDPLNMLDHMEQK